MSYILILIISLILLLPGLAIAFIPSVPNMVYMFLVVVLFGLFDKFDHVTSANLLVLGIIVFVVMLLEFISGLVGAKWGGSSWKSVFYGLAGLVLGSFMIPVPIFGGVIGMFLGVLLSELYRTNDMRSANRAALGSLLGFLAGTGIRFVGALVFFVMFVVYAWK